MGYSYNFKKHKFDKNGLLIVKIKQNDADIFINGKNVRNIYRKSLAGSMATKLNSINEYKIPLLPDEYILKIVKENYWPLEKKIIIKPNLTTFAPAITLFKRALPIKLIDGEIKYLLNSPSDKNFFAISAYPAGTSTLVNYYFDGRQNIITDNLPKSNFEIMPSFNGSQLLLDNEDNPYVISAVAPNKKILLEKKLTNLKWDGNSSHILYGLGKDDHIIYKVDLLLDTDPKPITVAKCEDYIMFNNKLYVIENDNANKKTSLKTLDDNDRKIIALLPYSENFKFLESNKLLIIKDYNSSVVYIIDPAAPFYNKIKATIFGIRDFDWNARQDKLLYTNDFGELWSHDLNENKEELITRRSSQIKDLKWQSENYIIFSTDNDINLIEMNVFDRREELKLFDGKNISDIIIDEKGKNLYFAGDIGIQKGLYQLELW